MTEVSNADLIDKAQKDGSGAGNTSAVDTLTRATASGSGPAFNIVIGSDALKSFGWLFGGVLVACLLISVASLGTAIWAVTMTSATSSAVLARNQDKLDMMNRNLWQDWYWSGLVYQKLDAAGVKVPLPPRPSFEPSKLKKE